MQNKEFYLDNTLQNYNIGEKIGNGAYGNVYIISENYVVKRMENFSSFSEVDICFSLQHENIIKGYGLKFDKDQADLILERCDCTLYEYVKKNPFDWEIVSQSLFGLYALYQYGYLHLDITPKNILLKIYDDRIVVKIADFSLSAKMIDNEVYTNKKLITVTYRPIENLKGSCKYDEKSDIWSLGMTIQHALSGMYFYRFIENIEYHDEQIDWEYSITHAIDKHQNNKKWPMSKYNLINDMIKYNKNERLSYTEIFEKYNLIISDFTLKRDIIVKDYLHYDKKVLEDAYHMSSKMENQHFDKCIKICSKIYMLPENHDDDFSDIFINLSGKLLI